MLIKWFLKDESGAAAVECGPTVILGSNPSAKFNNIANMVK